VAEIGTASVGGRAGWRLQRYLLLLPEHRTLRRELHQARTILLKVPADPPDATRWGLAAPMAATLIESTEAFI
jgi:transposase